MPDFQLPDLPSAVPAVLAILPCLCSADPIPEHLKSRNFLLREQYLDLQPDDARYWQTSTENLAVTGHLSVIRELGSSNRIDLQPASAWQLLPNDSSEGYNVYSYHFLQQGTDSLAIALICEQDAESGELEWKYHDLLLSSKLGPVSTTLQEATATFSKTYLQQADGALRQEEDDQPVEQTAEDYWGPNDLSDDVAPVAVDVTTTKVDSAAEANYWSSYGRVQPTVDDSDVSATPTVERHAPPTADSVLALLRRLEPGVDTKRPDEVHLQSSLKGLLGLWLSGVPKGDAGRKAGRVREFREAVDSVVKEAERP